MPSNAYTLSNKDAEDVYNIVLAVLCVICGGLASGLTMGLMSLDNTKLQIKSMIGTPSEVDAAKCLLPIISEHHLLLVTLLLFNAIAMEALPIFLGALVPNYIAVLISVTLVLIFGEVISYFFHFKHHFYFYYDFFLFFPSTFI